MVAARPRPGTTGSTRLLSVPQPDSERSDLRAEMSRSDLRVKISNQERVPVFRVVPDVRYQFNSSGFSRWHYVTRCSFRQLSGGRDEVGTRPKFASASGGRRHARFAAQKGQGAARRCREPARLDLFLANLGRVEIVRMK